MPARVVRQFPLLITMELTVAEIYEVFARQFTAQAKAWRSLAKEEHEHADWLVQLQSAAQDGLTGINGAPYDDAVLLETQQRLDVILAQAKAGTLTAGEAARAAIEIESSVLERHFYEMIDPTNPLLSNIYTNLQQATAIHAERVKALLKEVEGA